MMPTLEQLKTVWNQRQDEMQDMPFDRASLEKVTRSRVNKHIKTALQYFWASFALQVLVYSMLSHVIIKYWYDKEIFFLCIGAVFLFLPFTIVLMQKFKSLASTRLSKEENTGSSLYDFVLRHQTLLRKFYRFKKWYEMFLTPLSSAIGVIVIFKLYVLKGFTAHLTGAIITFIITVVSCAAAIVSENKKSFREPIRRLQEVLDDFRQDEAF